MNILSLFDGISVARVALDRANIKVDKYFSSEIDKFAIKIAQKNYPDTIQLGDVKNITKDSMSSYQGVVDIDLLIGGSPCQDLSIAKRNREGLGGSRSGLFYEYVRILNEIKPKYFILENVNSMSKEAKEEITRQLFNLSEDEWELIDDSIN
jgi:DNA-cytosine methyltransferase